jgi:lysophospholipase L1-like esterase
MRKYRWVSLGLLVLFVSSLVGNLVLFRYAQSYYLQLNSVKLNPISMDNFDNRPFPEGWDDYSRTQVIFFGDSRANEWPAPANQGWAVLSRAVGGETSEQAILRYEDHVLALEPDIVLVQTCINDLKTIGIFPERRDTLVAQCMVNIDQIVAWNQDAGILSLLTTIFPVGRVSLVRRPFWPPEIDVAIREVNAHIRSLAGSEVMIFDAYALLVAKEGRLDEAYRFDELHLNDAGYAALNAQLEALFKD